MVHQNFMKYMQQIKNMKFGNEIPYGILTSKTLDLKEDISL